MGVDTDDLGAMVEFRLLSFAPANICLASARPGSPFVAFAAFVVWTADRGVEGVVGCVCRILSVGDICRFVSLRNVVPSSAVTNFKDDG